MSEPTHLTFAASGNPKIRELLAQHPRVDTIEECAGHGISFLQGVWAREVVAGSPADGLYGLVELMDNNPIVCTDRLSVPGPAATLALIALAPLAQAGLIAESPALILNFLSEEDEIAAALGAVGWTDGIALHSEVVDLDGVLAATAMVSVKTPEDLEELSGLYEEQFGRSFYVRRDESSEWAPDLVAGQPFAVYRFQLAADMPNSLLTIRVLADREGKCGAAQMVHAMNVMCGFEESLGVN